MTFILVLMLCDKAKYVTIIVIEKVFIHKMHDGFIVLAWKRFGPVQYNIILQDTVI